MREKCAEYARLEAKVSEILGKLVELTTAQRKAFLRQDFEEFMRLDKKLELVVGDKERNIGALRQHKEEHQC